MTELTDGWFIVGLCLVFIGVAHRVLSLFATFDVLVVCGIATVLIILVVSGVASIVRRKNEL